MVPRVSVVIWRQARAACSQAARACPAASAQPSKLSAMRSEPCCLARVARVVSRIWQLWLITVLQVAA